MATCIIPVKFLRAVLVSTHKSLIVILEELNIEQFAEFWNALLLLSFIAFRIRDSDCRRMFCA